MEDPAQAASTDRHPGGDRGDQGADRRVAARGGPARDGGGHHRAGPHDRAGRQLPRGPGAEHVGEPQQRRVEQQQTADEQHGLIRGRSTLLVGRLHAERRQDDRGRHGEEQQLHADGDRARRGAARSARARGVSSTAPAAISGPRCGGGRNSSSSAGMARGSLLGKRADFDPPRPLRASPRPAGDTRRPVHSAPSLRGKTLVVPRAVRPSRPRSCPRAAGPAVGAASESAKSSPPARASITGRPGRRPRSERPSVSSSRRLTSCQPRVGVLEDGRRSTPTPSAKDRCPPRNRPRPSRPGGERERLAAPGGAAPAGGVGPGEEREADALVAACTSRRAGGVVPGRCRPSPSQPDAMSERRRAGRSGSAGRRAGPARPPPSQSSSTALVHVPIGHVGEHADAAMPEPAPRSARPSGVADVKTDRATPPPSVLRAGRALRQGTATSSREPARDAGGLHAGAACRRERAGVACRPHDPRADRETAARSATSSSTAPRSATRSTASSCSPSARPCAPPPTTRASTASSCAATGPMFSAGMDLGSLADARRRARAGCARSAAHASTPGTSPRR